MPDLTLSPEFLVTATTFAVVALATVSLALLWEGVRRWRRNRAATQVLRKIMVPGGERPAPEAARPASLLADERETPLPAWLEPALLRVPHREDLQRLLDRAGSRWSVATLLLASTGCALALGLATAPFLRGPVIPLLAAAAGAYLPIALVKLKASRRSNAFEAHFAEAIDLLARAARAGHSLAAGLEVVAQEAEDPVATEFRQVYEEQRFGLPLKESLLSLADRVDLVDVRIFVTAVLIQRESGGNLAENLDNLSGVIRARFRFKRDVKTKTAHGRMTGMVVALAPVVAGIMMYTLNPGYMEPLLVEPQGRSLLLAGGVMMVVGFLVIRRMVDVKA